MGQITIELLSLARYKYRHEYTYIDVQVFGVHHFKAIVTVI